MVVDFASDESGQMVLLENFVFVENLTKAGVIIKTEEQGGTYIFSIASDISGQNSSTMLSSFLKAKTFNSGRGSSSREIIPAGIYKNSKSPKVRL